MSPAEIVLVVAGVIGMLPALWRLLRDIHEARLVVNIEKQRITLKLEDGSEVAGDLDRADDAEELLKVLPSATQVSVR